MLLITHDPLVATSAGRILEMRDGRLVADTASRELAPQA